MGYRRCSGGPGYRQGEAEGRIWRMRAARHSIEERLAAAGETIKQSAIYSGTAAEPQMDEDGNESKSCFGGGLVIVSIDRTVFRH